MPRASYIHLKRHRINMRAPKIQKIFDRFKAANPQPKTELVYTTPFELLVATMLSAQATDVSVNKATPTLPPTCPSSPFKS